MTEKRDAPGAGTPGTSGACETISVQNSIQQKSVKSQAAGNENLAGEKYKGRKTHIIPYCARLHSVAIKCYLEQLVNGFDHTAGQVKKLEVDKSKIEVLMIIHNRDLVTDGPWDVSTEKPHIHLIMRLKERNARFTLSQMMKYFGIEFRPGVDDSLWVNHGVEPVVNFAGYAMYLTHETPQAIRDGKALYEISEIVSNLTEEEIKQVREGYNRLTLGKHRVTAEELVEMDGQAYNLGLELGDFEGWYGSQGFNVRSNAKMKTIRESYMRGVDTRVRERAPVNRLCIYIEGAPNTGKTYAATKALAGRRVLTVGGGGTGKFDNLRADTEAIVVDDDVCPNLLNMTDNYVCRAYRRNKDNPVWAGKYFIVTSNLPFDAWIRTCGIKTHRLDGGGYTQHYAAMYSRFYICRLAYANGVNHLALTDPSERGSVADQQERVKLFLDFKAAFDKTIAEYRPGMNKVDYSTIIEPCYPTEHWMHSPVKSNGGVGIVYDPNAPDKGY